jgi:hypothetical protein
MNDSDFSTSSPFLKPCGYLETPNLLDVFIVDEREGICFYLTNESKCPKTLLAGLFYSSSLLR